MLRMQNRLKMTGFNVDYFRIVQNQVNRELKLKRMKKQFNSRTSTRKNFAFFKPFALCTILFALSLAYSVYKNSLNLRIG